MSLQLQFDRVLAGRHAAAVDLKLQLGCGANILPGWINTDSMPSPNVDYLDFSRQFPFVDGIFAAVFCEHTIEHVSKPHALGMLREIFRVLRPGGLCRVVTPSLDNLARLLLDPQGNAAQKYLHWCRQFLQDPKATLADAINLNFYGHGHQHIYMVEEMIGMLRDVGFTGIKSMPAGSYGNEIFQGVDGHGRFVGEELATMEAFAVEAEKRG